MKKLFLLLLLLPSSFALCQSVPPSGISDPRGSSQLNIYDWTAPLNWPNDAAKFLRGDRTWAIPSGASGTVPFIPYVSALGTLSDSPLARFDANTIEQRNGANSQTVIWYRSYTDAANNSGIKLVNGLTSALQNFANGTGIAPNLAINAVSGSQLLFQFAGSTKARYQNTALGWEFLDKFGSMAGVSTAGSIGVASTFGSVIIAQSSSATRTDICMAVGPGTGAGAGGTWLVSGTFTVHAIQAGATAQTTLSWKDGSNPVTKTRVFNLDLSSTANQIDVLVPMFVSGTSNIQFVTTTAAIGVGTYDANISCVQLM